jgi:hypothetical protein
MSLPQTIGLEIHNITFKNRRLKFRKAMRELAKSLNVPCRILKAISHKEHGHEPYLYPVQQELSDRWVNFYRNILKNVYRTVVKSLDMPEIEIETIQKAMGEESLRYNGKILYNPQTGEPIKQKEFDALIKALENFLNRKTAGAGQKMILDAVAIEKILKRMAKYQSTKDMEKLTLDTLKYRGKTFDWISDSMKNMRDALRIDGVEMSRNEMARYQVAQDWVAQKVTRINNEAKEEIKDVILNGIVEKRSKSQVSQDLFNRLGSKNRDWKRIADTEIVNTSNLAGILEEVNHTPEGEKVYFKRFELPGCCDKCEKINDQIVLWSDTPLDNDRINDKYAKVAIWEGKPQGKKMNVIVTGTLHPNCRGGWTRWYPDDDQMDAILAHIQNKGQLWDKSVEKAREEFKAKGIENPIDNTKGFTDRVNEIYRLETD